MSDSIVTVIYFLGLYWLLISMYGIFVYSEMRRRRNRESRERQAKLEAFWKEEQLRLNPPPKRISQHTSHLEDALWEMTLWDIRDNEERKSRAAGK